MKRQLVTLLLTLLATTHAQPSRGQAQSAATKTAAAGLLEHVNQLRATTLPCTAHLTFSSHDALLGECALFFRITPCSENGDTTTVGGEPCLFGEIAYRNGASKIATIRFDTIYQEGGHAEPADHFLFNKGGKNYFVVLYKWPAKHYAIEGAFYQARVYRIEKNSGIRVWRNGWLFDEEYDGYAEGRRSRAMYKTRPAIERKLRSADIEKAPHEKR